MLKKLCLSVVFATLPMLTQSLDRSLQITNTLEHIEKTKKDILLEMRLALSLQEKSESHFENIFLNNYKSIKTDCLALLRTIALSPEFISTVEQVTNEQLNLIIDNLVNFNDIVVDPSFYPLEEKVKNELSMAGFDEQKEQVFNVFYLTYAILRGSQTLLRKLKIKERELTAELQDLRASEQTASA